MESFYVYHLIYLCEVDIHFRVKETVSQAVLSLGGWNRRITRKEFKAIFDYIMSSRPA